MKEAEKIAIAFAKWIDLNYHQDTKIGTYRDELYLVYTIEELFDMFKRLNN